MNDKTNPASVAPAAEAPQAGPPDSPPASPAVATPPAAEVAAAPPAEVAAPAETVKPEIAPSLLEQFDKDQKATAEAKPDDKPAGDGDKAAPADDKPKGDDVKPDAKPADAAAEKPADAKPEDGKPAEPEKPALEPVAYEYTLPETIKMDDALKGEFHTALDGFRADPVKGAQNLIALHEKTMQDYDTYLRNEQVNTWNDTRKDWNKQVLADEQIGGSGHQTAMGVIARMRDMFVPEKDRPAFEEFLRITGAGDHPMFLRMLHNVGRKFDEGKLPPENPKPPPDIGRNPSRRGIMYDHPRSNPNRQ